jgi:hypothetical protein
MGVRATFTASASILGLPVSETLISDDPDLRALAINYCCPNCERPMMLHVAGQLGEPPGSWSDTCTHCDAIVVIMNE